MHIFSNNFVLKPSELSNTLLYCMYIYVILFIARISDTKCCMSLAKTLRDEQSNM